MLGLALTVVLAQASCFDGLGRPRAMTWESILSRHLPLSMRPGDVLDTPEAMAAERARSFETTRALLIELRQTPAAFDELVKTKEEGLARLDAYLARFPSGSQIVELGNEQRDVVKRECQAIRDFQHDVATLDVAWLGQLTPPEGDEDPFKGLLAASLRESLNRLDGGWDYSPLLTWFGRQMATSVPPMGKDADALVAAECTQPVEELLWAHDRWREVASGLTLEQLVKFAAIAPAIELIVEDKWCGSSAKPSVSLDASGFHEIAIRKYDGCGDKWMRGVFGLTRGTRDPMTKRVSSSEWLGLIGSVRLKVGAKPMALPTTW